MNNETCGSETGGYFDSLTMTLRDLFCKASIMVSIALGCLNIVNAFTICIPVKTLVTALPTSMVIWSMDVVIMLAGVLACEILKRTDKVTYGREQYIGKLTFLQFFFLASLPSTSFISVVFAIAYCIDRLRKLLLSTLIKLL